MSELRQTGNTLKDIIDWVKEDGHCVVIHNNLRNSQVWFNNKTIDDQTKVVFVNVARMPGLLDEGEWDWYLKEDKCQRRHDFDLDQLKAHSKTHNLVLGH